MLIDFPNRGSQPDDGLDGQTRPDLITVPEAARMIGLHTDTLYRLCRTGQFDPAIQIGARWEQARNDEVQDSTRDELPTAPPGP